MNDPRDVAVWYQDDPRFEPLPDGTGWLVTPDDDSKPAFTMTLARNDTFWNMFALDGACLGGCDNGSESLRWTLRTRLGPPLGGDQPYGYFRL